MSLRVTILLPRRAVALTSWLLSLALAACLGWIAARTGSFDEPRGPERSVAIVTRAEPAPSASTASGIGPKPRVDPGRGPSPSETRAAPPEPKPASYVASEVARPPRSERSNRDGNGTAGSTPAVVAAASAGSRREPVADPTPSAPRPEGTATPVEAPPADPGSEDIEAMPRPAEPTSEPIVEQPQERFATTSPVATPTPGALARAERADRLAESGRSDEARQEAQALLAEHPSHAGLTAALLEAGAAEMRARLWTLRMVQLSGGESLSREIARDLKRGYLNVPEVVEAIRRWHVLTPRITSLDSSVVEGNELVVTGTLENPDIGDIRRVFVRIEALDTMGGVLATARARVRPKTLGPEGRGSFSARLEALDAGSVLRTRASVVEWESEVLDAG